MYYGKSKSKMLHRAQISKNQLKGLSYEMDLKNVDENWQILALIEPQLVFEFFGGTSDFLLKLNIFFPVNATITLITCVIRLILCLGIRRAFRTNAVIFYEQPIRGSIRFV